MADDLVIDVFLPKKTKDEKGSDTPSFVLPGTEPYPQMAPVPDKPSVSIFPKAQQAYQPDPSGGDYSQFTPTELYDLLNTEVEETEAEQKPSFILSPSPVTKVKHIATPEEKNIRLELRNRFKQKDMKSPEVLDLAVPVYIKKTLLPALKKYNGLLEGRDVVDLTQLSGVVNNNFLIRTQQLLDYPNLPEDLRKELDAEVDRMNVNYVNSQLPSIEQSRNMQKQIIKAADMALNDMIDLGRQNLPPPEQVDKIAQEVGFLSMQEAREVAGKNKPSKEEQEKLDLFNQRFGYEASADLKNYINLDDPRERSMFVWRMLDTITAADEALLDTAIEKISRIAPEGSVTRKALEEYRERGQVKGDPYLFSPEDKFSFTLANMESFLNAVDQMDAMQIPGSDDEINNAVDAAISRTFGLPVVSPQQNEKIMLKVLAGAMGFASGLPVDFYGSPSTWVGIGIPGRVVKKGEEAKTAFKVLKDVAMSGENKTAREIMEEMRAVRVSPGEDTHRFIGLKTPRGDKFVPLLDTTKIAQSTGRRFKSIPGVDYMYGRFNFFDDFIKSAQQIRGATKFGYGVPEAFVDAARREKSLHEVRRAANLRYVHEIRNVRKTMKNPELSMKLASLLVENPDMLTEQAFNIARLDPDRLDFIENNKKLLEQISAAGFTDPQLAREVAVYGPEPVARKIAMERTAGVKKEQLQDNLTKTYAEMLGKLPKEAVEVLKINDIGLFLKNQGYTAEQIKQSAEDIVKIKEATESFKALRGEYISAFHDTEMFKIHNFDKYLPHKSTVKGKSAHPFFSRKRIIDDVMLNDYLGNSPHLNLETIARLFGDEAEFTLARQKMLDLISSEVFGSVKLNADEFQDLMVEGVSGLTQRKLIDSGLATFDQIQRTRSKAFSNLSASEIKKVGRLPASFDDKVARQLVQFRNLASDPAEVAAKYKRFGLTKEQVVNLQEQSVAGLNPETLLKDLGVELFVPEGFVNYYPTIGVQHKHLDEEKLMEFMEGSDIGQLVPLKSLKPKEGRQADWFKNLDAQKIMAVAGNKPIYMVDAKVADHFDVVMDFLGGTTKNHRALSQGTSREVLKTFGRVYDHAVGSLKAGAMASPGFVLRNLQSNAFMYGLMGGRDPEYWGIAMKMLKEGELQGALKMGNEAVPFSKVMKEAQERGIISDFTNMAIESRERFRLLERAAEKAEVQGNIKRAETLRFAHNLDPYANWINAHDRANSFVERWSRLAMFLDQSQRFRKNGLSQKDSFDEAAKVIRQSLFNYDELTEFEKNVARRTVFFYTWVRNAIPFVTGQVLQNPGAFSGMDKAFDAMAQAGDEERGLSDIPIEALPDYLYEVGMLPLWANEHNAWVVNFDLPTAQAFGLDLATQSKSEKEFMAHARNFLNPIVGVGFEQLINVITDLKDDERAITVRVRNPLQENLTSNLMTDVDLTDHPLRIAGQIGKKYGTGAALVGAAGGFEIPAVVIAAMHQVLNDNGHKLGIEETIDIVGGTPGAQKRADKDAVRAITALMPIATRFSTLATGPTSTTEDKRNWMGAATAFALGLRISNIDPLQQQMLDAIVNVSKMQKQLQNADRFRKPIDKLMPKWSRELVDYRTLLGSDSISNPTGLRMLKTLQLNQIMEMEQKAQERQEEEVHVGDAPVIFPRK